MVLHDTSQSEALWKGWLQETGVPWPAGTRSMKLETTADLIASAKAGAALALVREGLAHEALSTGRLVRPWDHRLFSENGYHLVHAPARMADP